MAGMRITGSTVIRRYVSNLERNFYDKNKTENKIINNRKFTRASQNPMEAVKALKVRKAMAEIDTYQKNLDTAAGIYDSAENAVRQISGIIATVHEKLIQGAHGTYDVKTDKQIIAQEIEALADEMVRLMNLIVADRRIFGGVNNTDLAYELKDGSVFYNGVSVNQFTDPSMFPDGAYSYIDVGMGMRFLEGGYDVDPQTAIPVTFNGAEILGSGFDGKKYSVNFENISYGTWKEYFNQEKHRAFVLAYPGVPATQAALDAWDWSGYGGYADAAAMEAAAASNPTLQADYENFRDEMADKDYSFIVSLGKMREVITVKPGADASETVQNLNDALYEKFGDAIEVTANGLWTTTALGMELAVRDNPAYYGQSAVYDVPSGYPKNIIQLTLDAAKACRSGDGDETALYADLVFASNSFLSLSIAKIGSEQKFIEFNQERLQNNVLSLKEQQNLLEFPDLSEESTNWKMLEMIYNASLQMSTSTIPMSIFSFMR
ncbi:MAG: hypothetical protein LBI38_06370 [Oscillospiraceae bacterium]|nr:hypothetical protein [Oscillospiraceae bacterium]